MSLDEIVYLPLGVPGQEIFGVLQLVNKNNKEEISVEEREILFKFGPILGNFIKNCLINCRLDHRINSILDGFQDVKVMVNDRKFKKSLLTKTDLNDPKFYE